MIFLLIVLVDKTFHTCPGHTCLVSDKRKVLFLTRNNHIFTVRVIISASNLFVTEGFVVRQSWTLLTETPAHVSAALVFMLCASAAFHLFDVALIRSSARFISRARVQTASITQKRLHLQEIIILIIIIYIYNNNIYINRPYDVTYLYRDAADRFRALGLFGLGSPAMLMSGEEKRERIKSVRI